MPPNSKSKSTSKSKTMLYSQKQKSQKERDIKLLPEPFKVCLQGGWIWCVQKVYKNFTVMFQNKFESKFFSQPYVDTITGTEKKNCMSITSAWKRSDQRKHHVALFLTLPFHQLQNIQQNNSSILQVIIVLVLLWTTFGSLSTQNTPAVPIIFPPIGQKVF